MHTMYAKQIKVCVLWLNPLSLVQKGGDALEYWSTYHEKHILKYCIEILIKGLDLLRLFLWRVNLFNKIQ